MTTSPTARPAAGQAGETDPRILLGKSLDQIDWLIDGLTPDTMHRPTPCLEFDVRTLVRHLVSVTRRLPHIATGGDPFDIPHVAEDDIADTELVSAYRAARAELDRIWAEDSVLDTMVRVPWGEVPGRGAAMVYVQEMVMHAWDLGTSVGQTERLDPALGEAALRIATQFLPAQPRGGEVPFGPVIEVPESADDYQRLAGWLGRQP